MYNPDKPEPKKKEEGEEDEEEEEAEEEQEEEVRKCVASKIILRIPVVLLAQLVDGLKMTRVAIVILQGMLILVFISLWGSIPFSILNL